MGVLPLRIDDKLRDWIFDQPLFFVATAPTGPGGHVNISPKGDMRTFAVLGPTTIAYVDLFGSGVETVAHIKENGRILIMMCAFHGAPRILRLHGRGRVVEIADPDFEELLTRFEMEADMLAAVRAEVVIEVERISESCGYGVPLMDVRRDRGALYKTAHRWTIRSGEDAVHKYCDINNAESIDGLPGLRSFGTEIDEADRKLFTEDKKL